MTNKIIRRAQILEGISEATKRIRFPDSEVGERTRKKEYSGIGGNAFIEAAPSYKETKTEKVFSNGHNAWIVLGRDRPGNEFSGYGGRGDTHCGSIDIVAGRMSYMAKSRNAEGEKIYVNPDPIVDAARVLVTQKTDVDKNFNLPRGAGPPSDVRSAVLMKADVARIVAREGVNIVAGVSKTNSQGGSITPGAYGINLMANGTDAGLQPLVKGDNLESALKDIIENLDQLNGIMISFVFSQIKYNAAIAGHTHVSPFFGIPDTPPPVLPLNFVKSLHEQLTIVLRDLVSNKINSVFIQPRYLWPVSGKYIKSHYNRTN